MNYVGFINDQYEYFSEDKSVLFSSDNSHQYLLDYIYKDLRRLSDSFDKYISNRINTSTFEPINCTNSKDEIKKIIKKLKTIHPYFEHNYKYELKNKIGNYYNQLLVYTINNQNSGIHKYAIQKQWYIERLTHLMPSAVFNDDEYENDDFYEKKSYDDFYNIFCESVGKPAENGEEIITCIIPSEKPRGLDNEIKLQNTIRNLLYFIFDISAPTFKNLNTHQRIWLYKNIFSNINPTESVTQHLLLFPQRPYGKEDPKDDLYKVHNLVNTLYEHYELSNLYKTYERDGIGIRELPNLRYLDVEHNGILDNISNIFNSIIEYARKVSETAIYEAYEVKDLQQLLYLEIVSMLRSGTIIKKCRNCGKYFVTSDKRKGYCDRISKNGLPCSEIGIKKRYSRKIKEDPALRIYNRAYKKIYARYDEGIISESQRKDWKKKAKKMLDEYRSGKLSFDDFQARIIESAK